MTPSSLGFKGDYFLGHGSRFSEASSITSYYLYTNMR
jgi:hypothetical protein